MSFRHPFRAEQDAQVPPLLDWVRGSPLERETDAMIVRAWTGPASAQEDQPSPPKTPMP